MFSKPEKEQDLLANQIAAIRAMAQDPDTSIVGVELTVVGDIDCDGDLRIFGAVAGDVRGRVLIIEPSGQIEGRVSAERVHVCGEVTGSVTATDVSMASSARVVGNITHNHLHVEPGAHHDGRRPWRPRTNAVNR